MVTQMMITSKNFVHRHKIHSKLIQQSNFYFSTANGVPGSISEMVESWKVEQTCVTGPAPVMDSSAPCANFEARKEWAEKECYKVIIIMLKVFFSFSLFFILRLLINPTAIHFHLVLKNLMKRLYEHFMLSVYMMHASTQD